MLTLPNYQITEQIYESANSIVFRGKSDKQPVILKVLKQDYPTPAELIRYQQEYEITHSLNSDGIIRTYGIEKYQNTLVIILEDFGGESLKQISVNNQFTLIDFLMYAIKITDILGNIHIANIIHKDINPSNIVINPKTNELKIIDFGISSRLQRENPTLTNPEQLEGTLAYLSPEQTGRINRSIDYRTDLYSLGVTLYEILTGKLPFTATDAMELVHCHIAKTPIPIHEVNFEIPQIISDIVMKLMAKNPENRYQSAFGVKADLDKCLNNIPHFKSLTNLQFELAQHDFSGKLEIPQKLYGRSDEVNTLLTTFKRVAAGTTEMMLVAGYSGVGKTALVHEVHKPMTEKYGYFAAGKFDQFQKNIPYSVITQAFNDLCHYFLMDNTEVLATWKTKILDAVGNNGKIIIDVVPDLELIIGKQPEVVAMGPTEAQNRFNMFFIKFVKALCDKDHPFILFIDDLQWVDSASLDLLKNIMLDGEIQHLLIIGAYRDNEVDSSHQFIMTVDELQKNNVIVNTIFLANLQPVDINHLLQDSLLCDDTQPLTDLVYQKTQGNAFFTHQFLHALYEENLLNFDFKRWHWNIKQIAAQNITNNVVELMANKIDKLPTETSTVLQKAACIGNQFSLSILTIIYEQDNTLSILIPAIIEGLIQPLDEHYKHPETAKQAQFKFLHDRVQQAAYVLIDDAHKKTVHLQIGRLLLENTATEILEDKVFDIVGQFNQSIELINVQTERLKIAQLNLLAGKKAKLATAYEGAINYFTVGLKCLDQDCWQNNYELTFELYKQCAECEYLLIHIERSEELFSIAIENAKTDFEKAEIYVMQMKHSMAFSKLTQALERGRKGLMLCGINFPIDEQSAIQTESEKLTKLMQNIQVETLVDTPEMTDKNKMLGIRILSNIALGSYLSGNSKSFTLSTLMSTNLSLTHGQLDLSASIYGWYGLLLSTKNELKESYKFGKLALALSDKYPTSLEKTQTYNLIGTFLVLLNQHLKHATPVLMKGYQSGLDIGDVLPAIFCFGNLGMLIFASGETLENVLIHLEQSINISYKNKVYSSGDIACGYQQLVNFLATGEQQYTIADDTFSIEQLNRIHSSNSIAFIMHVRLQKSFWFGNYAEALEIAKQAESMLDMMQGYFLVYEHYFLYPLILAALYPDCSEPAEYLQQIKACEQKLKFWAESCPENFLHRYLLVKAEIARIDNDGMNAVRLYDQAIKSAKENNFTQNAALGNELAAKFWLMNGKENFASIYIREAHYLYDKWGATAKAKDLEIKYPQLLTVSQQLQNLNPTINATTLISSISTKLQISTVLDLSSVTKASETLAGEIVLSKLLEKIMQIVIENAGAERGLLILVEEEQLIIEAEGSFDIETATILQSLPIEGYVPTSVVNYVARSHEPVVLANAMQDGIYIEDNYIQHHQLKSILCSPILHQGKLIGLLYLENNLMEGAFTEARLKVVDMLSSQAAISLENALLYRTLEDKVKRRTAQLDTANQEITHLNKQLKQENMRMGAELDIAKQLQQMVLPKEDELQQIENLDIAGFMEPADEVGGDYYEVLNHDGHIKIGIGDVTGHGLESGVLMLMVQTAVRTLLVSEVTNPQTFLNFINRVIHDNIKRIGSEKNLTLSLLDYQDGQLTITGQHEDILLVRKNGKIELIDTLDLGFSIGILADISKFIAHQKISLQSGDGIVLYTDGITEAQNSAERQYGLERLCEVVSDNWSESSKKIQQVVITDVKKYIGEQEILDDITLLVLKQE